jgi:anti-sigma B factor antagonist
LLAVNRSEERSTEKVVTMFLDGEIAERELVELNEMLFRLANKGTRNVVIDFAEVSHLDYRGVKPLLARAELFRNAGGDIKLSGLSAYLAAILRSVGAHESFDVFAGPREARDAFGFAARLAG